MERSCMCLDLFRQKVLDNALVDEGIQKVLDNALVDEGNSL